MSPDSKTTVSREVIVTATPGQAFEAFTTGIDRWWPRQGFSIGASPLREVVLECRPGGRWYERGADGGECSWGRVLIWEPGVRLVLAWQLSGEWTYDADLLTEVELRFTDLGDGRTRVTLEHRLDGYGPQAGDQFTVYDSPQAWQRLLADYAGTLPGAAPVPFDQYTVVRLVLRPDAPDLSPQEAADLQDAHMARIAQLAAAGHILAAGPPASSDDPQWRGLSIWSTDPDTTRTLCAEDPAVKAGRLQPLISTWLLPRGQLRFHQVRVPRAMTEVSPG